MNLHITTNTIRSIVETEMDALHEVGDITNAERNAIMNLNGHSSAITKDYYIRRDRSRDVKHALSAFTAIKRQKIDSDSDSDEVFRPHLHRHRHSFIDSDEETENYYRQPGLGGGVAQVQRERETDDPANATPKHFRDPEHKVVTTVAHRPFSIRSSTNKVLSRNKWTDEEINFVGDWCSKTLLRNPENQNNIVARCLSYIQNHSDVATMFHPNHILSSGRLKHGLDSYKKKQEETK